MKKEFYSNGKLLLTGEYAVLDGAKALATPTTYGQSLTVIATDTNILSWKSLNEMDEVWFDVNYNLESMNEISSTSGEISKTLLNILNQAQKLNPYFLMDGVGYAVETQLTFPRDWGLGTSSTLINNIAQWADINPYRLLKNTFGGSGYDIACANHKTPIIYQLENGMPTVQEVHFDPNFKDQLFFVYLNIKQNSRQGITHYRRLNSNIRELVNTIEHITSKMILCRDLTTFETLLDQHERILSETLKIPTVKKLLFHDYEGAIKSLGAWGGDFILATGNSASMEYFRQKDYNTIIPFSEMVL